MAENNEQKQRGGVANLRPPSTSEEAREYGRRGGIASGIARRKRITLRDELTALFEANGGVVARSIAVAICKEAKNGNVGAFRAIAQVLGELKEFFEPQDALPPPIVISVHDPAYIEAERERQKREFADLADAAVIELKPEDAENGAESGETWGAKTQPLDDGPGNGATVAPTGAGNWQESGTGAAVTRSEDAEASAQGGKAEAPQGAGNAPVEEPSIAKVSQGKPSESQAKPQPPQPPPPPPPRVPRSPSEAARMRREQEERERAANGGQQAAKPYRAVPVTFPKR